MTDVGRVGIWSGQLRRSPAAEIVAAAAELEGLGFGALWIPGGRGGNPSDDAARILAATERTAVAIGVVNIWAHPPTEVAKTRDYLAELDLPRENVVLGALGPKMLDLAREHARGAHPYLTTVEHVVVMRRMTEWRALAASETA